MLGVYVGWSLSDVAYFRLVASFYQWGSSFCVGCVICWEYQQLSSLCYANLPIKN